MFTKPHQTSYGPFFGSTRFLKMVEGGALLIVAALAYTHQNGEILHSMEADAAGVNTMVQHLEAVPIDASSGTCKNEGDFCSGNHCVKVPCRAKNEPGDWI